MQNLLKGEFLKNGAVRWFLVSVLLPVAAVFVIKTQIADRVENYIDIPMDTYIYSIFSNVYLLFLLPCFMLLLNVYFSVTESRENGWLLVVTNVKNPENVFQAKLLLNAMIVFFSYLSYTGVACYLLRERGASILFSVVAGPMLCSFFCFLPVVLIMEYVCILLPYVMEKVFFGILLILAGMFAVQTKFNIYYFPGYYFVITQDDSRLAGMTSLCVLLALAGYYAGAKWMGKYIRNLHES